MEIQYKVQASKLYLSAVNELSKCTKLHSITVSKILIIVISVFPPPTPSHHLS